MKKLLFILMFILMCTVTFIFSSCTQNQRARNFGGSAEVKLPRNCILINATWKQNDLWILVEDTITHKKTLIENSNFGILEGSYSFK